TDTGKQVQFLPQIDVDAAESLADWRRDRRLEGHFVGLDRLQNAVGNLALRLDHFDPTVLHIPVDFDPDRLDAFGGGFSDFGPYAVTGNQSDLIHLDRLSQAMKPRRP